MRVVIAAGVIAVMGWIGTIGLPVAAGTQATVPVQSDQRVTAGRFAVREFKTAQGLGQSFYGLQTVDLENAVVDMLTTEMANAGFDVMERQRLGEVMAEQDLGASGRVSKAAAAPIGTISGAQFLVVGTITEWGLKQQQASLSSYVQGDLGRLGGRKSEARVAIHFRVLDAVTGKVVTVGEAKGIQANYGLEVKDGWWRGVDFSQEEWTQSQIGKATRKAVASIAKQLKQKYPVVANGGVITKGSPAVEADIVALAGDDTCIINKGATAGLKVGDMLEVFHTSDIKDKDGAVVYREEKKLARGEVVSVQPAGAKIKITGTEGGTLAVQAGDVVRVRK